MSARRRRSGGQRAWRFVVDALAGRLGVLLMTLAYAGGAVMLLAYVSTQVYTCSLQEDIARRRNSVRDLEEQTAILMTEYRSLTSRDRVMTYCRDRLGMTEADPVTVSRIRIEGDDARVIYRDPLPSGRSNTAEILPGEFDGLTEVLRR